MVIDQGNRKVRSRLMKSGQVRLANRSCYPTLDGRNKPDAGGVSMVEEGRVASRWASCAGAKVRQRNE